MFARPRQMTHRQSAARRPTHAVIDIETTGLCPSTDAITEIAVVLLLDGRPMTLFTELVDPCRPIPPAIVEMTGITDAMVERSPRVYDVLPTVIDLVGAAVVVGHNVLFDLEFLSQASLAQGLPPLVNSIVCTADLARKLLGETIDDHCLGTVARHLDVARQATHRALGDALVTAEVFRRLTELESSPLSRQLPARRGPHAF